MRVYILITQEHINFYIEKIPPMPKTLKVTMQLLQESELLKASQIAKTDKALSSYLKELVNKPIYGFKNEVQDIAQIFGILGVIKSQQVVYNYMVSLLSPSQWNFFQLNKTTFYTFQADLSVGWQKILAHLGIKDREFEATITLLPASVIVSEALFCEKKEDITLLKSVKEINLNTILQRLCNQTLFDICETIAKKWDMEAKTIALLHASSGIKPANDPMCNTLGKWMHLFLFYTLSKPIYIEAGLNDFIEFNIDYVEDIYEDFALLMEVA